MTLFRTVLAAAITLEAVTPRIAASQRDTVDILPGDGHVQGSILRPYSRRYTILEFGCDSPDSSSSRLHGSYTDALERSGDTAFLRIQTWHRSGTEPVIDSSWVDSRTLAPLASHTYIGVFRGVWRIRKDTITYWSSDLARPETRPLDTTLAAPAFSPAEVELLLQATPAIYAKGQAFRFRALDLQQNPGEAVSGFYVHAIDVLTRDSAAQAPVHAPSAPFWAVTVYGDDTYWIDRRSHVPVAWQYPQYESVCPQRYILAAP
jgi:hypothetical protein